ncbi:hypothetical protein SAMN05216337_104255 [Bradyrhizobium brasilense]|uniref:Uncharacterized protein n=1 Tax=Bradyrhizobium brasilense TaxID=1419277 RepID=A0A1G7HM47_9BRAD|nr:hypothetical protein SAMN05216337_104255 [Bradyrhizobium brasilense]
MLGEPSLPSVAGLGLEAIDEVDDLEEAAAGTGSDAASGDGNGQVGFACAGAANQHDVALLGDEAAASEIIDESLIDRRAVELEVGDVLGKRQLGNGELIISRRLSPNLCFQGLDQQSLQLQTYANPAS